MDRSLDGMVLTARGPVSPEALSAVLMHEHLHMDCYDWERQAPVTEERPATVERRQFLLEQALPALRQCADMGCRGLVEATMPPWRAWPDLYVELSEASGVHIILCTGFYREMEVGRFWVTRPEEAIWQFVLDSEVERLAEFCISEIEQGTHGTAVRAGAIKLGTSEATITAAEEKTFRAGARAQRATGVHITTHCLRVGAQQTQLALLEAEGVDLTRVVIGHTAPHLMDPQSRASCIGWMRQGANFMPSNLAISGDAQRWRPLVEAIHEVFDAGLGDRLVFGQDWAFTSESGPFGPCSWMPGPPFAHMLTHTLPALRQMGLTSAEEDAMMRTNPQRIVAVQL